MLSILQAELDTRSWTLDFGTLMKSRATGVTILLVLACIGGVAILVWHQYSGHVQSLQSPSLAQPPDRYEPPLPTAIHAPSSSESKPTLMARLVLEGTIAFTDPVHPLAVAVISTIGDRSRILSVGSRVQGENFVLAIRHAEVDIGPSTGDNITRLSVFAPLIGAKTEVPQFAGSGKLFDGLRVDNERPLNQPVTGMTIGSSFDTLDDKPHARVGVVQHLSNHVLTSSNNHPIGMVFSSPAKQHSMSSIP